MTTNDEKLEEGKGKCDFCEVGEEGLMMQLPDPKGKKGYLPCHRGVYSNSHCIATLSPEQYTRGHVLVILRNHRDDIADPTLTSAELESIIGVVSGLSRHLKEKLDVKRVYISSLCDGVEHLHFHLIPRYEINDSDRSFWFQITGVSQVAWKEKVNPGFWCVAQGEIMFCTQRKKHFEKWGFSSDLERRGMELEELARFLRASII